MSDDQEKQEPEKPIDDQETRPYQPVPPQPDTKDDEESVDAQQGTMSLFELMEDTARTDEPVDPDADTMTLSGDVDDDATPTGAPAPQTPTTQPAPLPLTPTELTPKDRPLEQDLDATTVQPRVAIPGKRPPGRPISEQPTQVHQPTKPSPPQGDDYQVQRPPSQRPVRQPVRQQPVRQQSQQPARQQPVRQTAQPRVVSTPTQQAQPQQKSPGRRNWGGCLLRFSLVAVMFAMVAFAISLVVILVGYRSIANDLPSVADLESQVSQFETAVIYDRNGQELYALADPNTGNRTRVSLDQISPYVISATIATEDSRFYENPGFDPIGIARAVVQAAQEGEAVSGASTITQQLVRAVLLDEEERTERTLRRKVREIILASAMNNEYEKNTILELYLNEIYYGNLAYGIEAAAQTYFNKPAKDLTLAEASLLAGLPQAPAAWDPYTAPYLAIGRQSEVLTLMVAEGYITSAEAQAALNETNATIYDLTPPVSTLRYPHFTLTALQQAEELLGAQSIYRGGLRIFTTIDPVAQELATTTVQSARANIQAAGANNAAMVVIEPSTGEVLALVGSVDFNDEAISGQVNMAQAPRQTGSSIKPLVYLSAMEKGWTPSTLIWDVPTSFPNGANPPYEPKNYDDRFHGPMLLRPSLGNSYNIPAVKALEYVGVCNFITNVQKLGLSSLQDDGCAEVGAPRNYGLSLSLGGGEISPLEMASAFGALANQGNRLPPFTIHRIENRQGEILYEQAPVDPNATQVVRPEHAYLLSDMLSDNSARQPAFGTNNSLVVPGHRVAAKTGTSGSSRFDVRDAWTIGYTPEVVTAVWVGNTDNQPIGEGQSGTQVAAPIWNRFMSQYLSGRTPVDFVRPAGVVDIEICADSGTRPGPGCQSRKIERFASDQPPLDSEFDFIQNVAVDLWTGLRANEHCNDAIQEAGFFDILVFGNEDVLLRERTVAQQWLENTSGGQAWLASRNVAAPLELPPADECNAETPRPEIEILSPQENEEIASIIDIVGSVNAPNFSGYQVEYGHSADPGGWALIGERQPNPVNGSVLASWDSAEANYSGPLTIRVIAFGPNNPYTDEGNPVFAEKRVVVNLLQPTATPTPTTTQTPTPTQTSTPAMTPTVTATVPGRATLTPTPEVATVAPTATIEPTIEGPTATPLPTNEPAPSPTATPEP